MTWFAILVIGLIGARYLAEMWLATINRRHVEAHAGEVPAAFKDVVDSATYSRSVEYTLAKSRFYQVELAYGTAMLVLILFSGILPWMFYLFADRFGTGAWSMGLFLFAVGLGMAILSWPLDWHAQFHLEERFGFNTTTPKLWWIDRVKSLMLAMLLGFPLLVLVLKIIEWTGALWWLWAWGALMTFQVIIMVLAPVLIMPLFNKFTPLPEGNLRERLLELARRTSFRAQNIQVMDGSKRSKHSNAFFTGFGRFRKIVLFDTLIQQLTDHELEAVLAHEIGHFKKKHILKFVVISAAGSLLSLYVLSVLAKQPWFYGAFGFGTGTIAPALLLFSLLSGVISFWLAPAVNLLSRRYEYEADAFAALTVESAEPLIGALRKLNEKNLSNLTPHPLYSGFHYSHPTLLERENALRQAARRVE
jgi:STE24 endopeptidase